MLGRLLEVGEELDDEVESKREEEEEPALPEASGPPSRRKRADPARLQIAAVRCSLLFRLVRCCCWVLLFVMVPFRYLLWQCRRGGSGGDAHAKPVFVLENDPDASDIEE